MSTKEIGLIGLGNMGKNIADKLHHSGYSLVLYNRTDENYPHFKDRERIYLSRGIKEFADRLNASEGSSIVWMMIPGGKATNDTIAEISAMLRKNDIVIDGSNSIYEDSIANYNKLKKFGISYLDVGCAGGPGDLLDGVALMVGGDNDAYERAEDVLKAVSGKGTYGYVGASGSGHMAKLVHNGIFYGIFPVYSEGVDLMLAMKGKQPEMNFDIKEALRLLGSCPPITTGIMKAIYSAVEEHKLPEDAPVVKISEMVSWEVEKAGKMGVRLSITKAILEGYSSMSEGSRRIYAGAKRILTGH
ncbi:MAG: NAD(P)-binding domain-containing protein [Candidatus Micrarchaeota archaeon]|nr:NAD(P)-binding domain-containing protein [Candidatus Micrarchaeota archaeon]